MEEQIISFGDVVQKNIFGEEFPIEEQNIEIEVAEGAAKEESKEKEKEEPAAEDKTEEVDNKEAESVIEEQVEESDYEKKAKLLVEAGIWDEFEVELEEGQEFDKEVYENLKKQQKEAKEEKLKEKVLSGLSKDEKEFIEFKKNVNNDPNALKLYVQSINNKEASERIDISTDSGKKLAVKIYYKEVVGWSDDKIEKHISRAEKDLELDEEAEMAESKIKTIVKEKHDKIVKEAEERAKEAEKKAQEYNESIEKTLKEQGYDNKKIKAVLKDITERDEVGLSSIDKLYLKAISTPEKVTKLLEFLSDEEEFVNKIAKKKESEAADKVYKKIKFKKTTPNSKTAAEVDNNNEDIVISLT